MKKASRFGDETDDPSAAMGPAFSGSRNVMINGRPALRIGDGGVCGGHAWMATAGASSVIVNNRLLCTEGSETSHPTGAGKMLRGSADVLVGPRKSRGKALASATKLTALSALDLSRISEVIKEPKMLLSFALRDAATLLGHYVGFKALGDIWPKVFGAIAVAWKVLRELPFFGKYIKSLEVFARNFFDTIAFTLLGDMVGYHCAPDGNIECPLKLPLSAKTIKLQRALTDLSSDKLPYAAYDDVPSRGDITWQIQELLKEIAPLVYYFPDDSPSISIEEMLSHGTWVSDGDKRNLDMYDEVHEPGFFSTRRGPYLRAFKLDHQYFVVMAGFLRSMGYWGEPHPDNEMVHQHEGDGERAYLFFQIDEIESSSPLQGRVRPVRIRAGAHGDHRVHGWQKFQIDQGRQRLNVARGSHALSIVEGRQRAKPTWYEVNSDYHAGPSDSNHGKSATHQIANVAEMYFIHGAHLDHKPLSWSTICSHHNPDALACFEDTGYDYKKSLWGYKPLWGKWQAFPGAKPSPVWHYEVPRHKDDDEKYNKHLDEDFKFTPMDGLPLEPSECTAAGCPVSEGCEQVPGLKHRTLPAVDTSHGDLASYATWLVAMSDPPKDPPAPPKLSETDIDIPEALLNLYIGPG